jgi:hypothetical protein
MTKKTRRDELKPYPDDAEGLSPTVKTVEVEPPAPPQGQAPSRKKIPAT